MVLGTAHLSKYRDDIDASDLEPLLQRLEAFAPDIIAIEATSGQVCEMLRMYEASYSGVAANYCVDPRPARSALGVTGPEAERLIAEVLDTWPSEPTPDDRRRLAALFLPQGNRTRPSFNGFDCRKKSAGRMPLFRKSYLKPSRREPRGSMRT